MVLVNVTKLDLYRLNEAVMALAGRLLAGKATVKNAGAARNIKKLENEVMKLMKQGSFEVGLHHLQDLPYDLEEPEQLLLDEELRK